MIFYKRVPVEPNSCWRRSLWAAVGAIACCCLMPWFIVADSFILRALQLKMFSGSSGYDIDLVSYDSLTQMIPYGEQVAFSIMLLLIFVFAAVGYRTSRYVKNSEVLSMIASLGVAFILAVFGCIAVAVVAIAFQ